MATPCIHDGLANPPALNSPQELNVFHASSEVIRIVGDGSSIQNTGDYQFKSCIFRQNAELEEHTPKIIDGNE